jgi:3-dehydroquinate dehydratase-2
MKVLVLHGVNLNLFGRRDPAQYGSATLADIDSGLATLAGELGATVECFQSNHEGAFVERIHQGFADAVDAVVVNAGAWTHSSHAIRDALEVLRCPVVEVHMSNVHAREPFRRVSVFADVVAGQVSGFGVESYRLGLRAAVSLARGR